MKNTIDAIKYGLETLDVSPKELFKLIESSKDYEGSDYKRWLSREIIALAENDGIGYSQLLAKWFNLIQNIIDEYADGSVKEFFANYIKNLCLGNVYTVGIESDEDGSNIFGKSADEEDWVSKVDMPYNYDFLDTLSEDMSTSIKEDNPITIIYRGNPKASFKKNCDLVVDSKISGIPVRNYDALFLYRMCTIVRALGDGCANLRFIFITDTKFLYSKDNEEIIKYLLTFFKYEETSCVVNTKDLYEGSFTSEDYAVCMFSVRGESDSYQDGIVLKTMEMVDGEYSQSNKVKRYSVGKDMLEALYEKYNETDYTDNVPLLNRSMDSVVRATKGIKTALGYMCKGNTDRSVFLSCYPVENTRYIAITKDNLYELIAYYGVTQSMDNAGMFLGINEIIDGHPDYMNLVCNCIPIFLFDVNSKFCSIGSVVLPNGKSAVLQNRFDVVSSKVVTKLLDVGSVYFSYEAKELIQVCKGLLDYFKENFGEDLTGRTFEEIRKEASNENLNRAYLNALSSCKEFVSSAYRQMS